MSWLIRSGSAGAVTVALTLSLASHPAAQDPIGTKVTFAREIRAIFSARCATCHARGGAAPMPLTTYDEVRPWARAIKEQVLARRMPVWHAARGFGAFANDPSLTPVELAAIVSWVDGGMPKGTEDAVVMRPRDVRGVVAPKDEQWIAGWSFQAGDPLITSATISSAAGRIGTWVAGDRPVVFPAGTAMRISGPIRIDVGRRPPSNYETLFIPRSSVVRVTPRADAPARRVWVEQATCGDARSPTGTLLAVRPLMDRGSSAHVWIQRPGAPAALLGWFRNFDPTYPRSYWLGRPMDLSVDARIQSDAPCTVELTLSKRWLAPQVPATSTTKGKVDTTPRR